MSSVFENDAEFAKFFHEHYASILLYLYRIIDDQAAAEDIASEVFVSLWNRNGAFSQIHSPKSYLYTSARNRALDWIKLHKRYNKRKTEAAAMEEQSERPVVENMIYAETMTRVYAAIDRLPTQCRKVFIMHYIQGKKISEIAAELNISVSSVRTHKGRGIELLQKGLLGMVLLVMINSLA
jgi:RNA polymerase sigma-70 factor (family 1)